VRLSPEGKAYQEKHRRTESYRVAQERHFEKQVRQRFGDDATMLEMLRLARDFRRHCRKLDASAKMAR